jgi:hypothetical protein
MLARFFRNFTKGSGSLTKADYQEVANTFNKIKELQNTNEIGNLRMAFRMVDQVEMKYPFCYDTARVIRGSVGSSLVDKIEELKEEKTPTYKR